MPGSESIDGLFAEIDMMDRVDSYELGMSSLDSFIGLSNVKEQIKNLVNNSELKKCPHLLFVGPPGSGKTAVANALMRIYYGLRIINDQILKEVCQKDLISPYIGQTAYNTKEAIEQSLGGILYIDNAHDLFNDNQQDYFANEAIVELLNGMENHRDDLVVILAGLEEPLMKHINENPSFAYRFRNIIRFDNYSDEELIRLFKKACEGKKYTYSQEGLDVLKQIIILEKSRVKEECFTNARCLKNLFDDILMQQAVRLSDVPNLDKDKLLTLEKEDFLAVLNRMKAAK